MERFTMERRDKRLVTLLMVIASFFLMGCSLLQCADSKAVEDMKREQELQMKDAEEAEKHKAEPGQALASGDLLSVRVNYGGSGATVCKVRIDNPRNDWYDYVEWTGAHGLGGGVNNYDDYSFGSTNFNKQITNPNNAPLYTPEAVEGEYRITITADTGYEAFATAHWDGKSFSPNLMSYSLD